MRMGFEALVRIATLVAATLAAGCVSLPRAPIGDEELRRQRRAEADLPLEERVARIERRLFSDFYEDRVGLVTQFNVVRGGRQEKGPVQVEQNAHLLVALACKYAVTRDPLTEERAGRLLAGLALLDQANGLDGFLPFEVRVTDGRIEVTNRRFISSSYTQMLFANVLAWRLFSDARLKAEIRTQSSRMLDHVIAGGLVVVDEHGRPLPYSDVSPKFRIFGTGRELETLSFVRAACFFAQGDPVRLPRLLALKKRVENDYGYASMPYILHVSLPLVELPTVSSSWLNFMKLATLVETTGFMKYRGLLHELADDYRRHENPFFIALDLLYGPAGADGWRKAQERIAWRRLHTYPLTNDSHEVNNVGRPSYRERFPPRLIKNSMAPEATRPIPLYDAAGDSYQWKRNPLLLQGNLGGDGSRVYSGVDFYEAYWLLAYAKSVADRD